MANAGQLKVTDTGTVKSIAGDIRGLKSSYTTTYQQMIGSIEGLSVSWEGETSQTFVNRFKSYQDDFDDMSRILETFCTFIENAMNDIESREQMLIQEAQQLSVDCH